MEDLEFVVEALMNNGDREAQVEAAIRIRELNRKQRHELAERGAIGPLISILRTHGGCEEAIEAALFALLALAFGSERNKVRIVKYGAVPVLLDLLQSQSEVAVELSVAAMMILSSCLANRPAIASSETVGILIAIIGDTGHSEQSHLDTISTLHSLTKVEQTIPLIVAHGGVSSLVEFIIASEKSLEAVEKAVVLLEAVAASSAEAVIETATASGGIQALVEVVEEGTPQAKEHAAAVLLLACQGSHQEGCRECILQEGALPGLLQLSVDGKPRAKDIAQRLLLLLRERVRDHQLECGGGAAGKRRPNKKCCSKMELVEEIMREIDTDGEVVVAATLRLVEEMVAKLGHDRPAASPAGSRLRFAHMLSGRLSIRSRRGS
ncbi:U-box domain-containing protein 6 [Punica granatum]|uniref:U-box domain-containing protein n=2 Tax=Punica granatum TaxID=22663 RepID=A0A218WQ40_PUNGR|nr:U-box domain-containing protein 6 [Punica granatum]OWM74925.1 hypothetical protein CDL15_Pgr021276 [Punica granatum]PKI75116.1 hypothetical protein CRG98_004451 [Punica granatum]